MIDSLGKLLQTSKFLRRHVYIYNTLKATYRLPRPCQTQTPDGKPLNHIKLLKTPDFYTDRPLHILPTSIHTDLWIAIAPPTVVKDFTDSRFNYAIFGWWQVIYLIAASCGEEDSPIDLINCTVIFQQLYDI
jgi:hypothetical protein